MAVRKATHAGTWYSSNTDVLDKELQEWLDVGNEAANATGTEETKSVRAIIAPHAGFRYSGPTAAHAYAYLQHLPSIKRVFILGPSHHVYLKGCALTTAAEYATPWGNVPTDFEVNEALMNTGKFSHMTLDVDEDEHSLEMQLPFIYKAMNGRKFSIIPIMVGDMKRNLEASYGRIFAPYFEDEGNLFVISSDFCHWGSRFRYTSYDPTYGEIHEYIEHLDHEGMEIIERMDAKAFVDYIDRTNNTICGRHPITVLLQAMSSATNVKCTLKFVKYAQSSVCKRHSDSSVSYAAGIVFSSP